MTSPAEERDLEAVAWSWIEHLRRRGTTTWREWAATGHPAVEPRWAVLPTAPQLEVVRRLAGSVCERSGAFDRLADLVLTTPVGGRGRVDPRLPGPGDSAGDRDVLEPRDLLRVCVAALARWCEANPTPPGRCGKRARRHRPWQASFVVDGCSPHAEAVRAALLAAGHAEGGRDPVVLVVGGPLEAMLAAHWRQRVATGAGVRWQQLWTGLVARGRLPGPVDLARLADRWREEHARVEIVLNADPADAVDAVGRILELDLDRCTPAAQDPVDTDLLRRLNQVLASKDPGARQRLLNGELVPLPSRSYREPLGVPAAHLGWALDQAEALVARLGDGPWVVHGDPRVVVPSTDAGLPRSVSADRTLDLALQVLLALEGGD
ncbi:MAG: hypothetical protein ACR2FG_03635 [Marmoricola sp.]